MLRSFSVRTAFLLSSVCLCAAQGTYESVPFAADSEAISGKLVRISEEASGLYVASEYKDPRAWRERLEPATIGTVGTGVGVGDFNNDGFPDLFVTMREGINRLYLNQAGKGFADHTQAAGILESPDWSTGVTVVDLNGDGSTDIYVSFYNAPNRLYLNRGDTTFEEVAEDWGLAVADASGGAYFADYDKDGDLDLYLQTNTIEGNSGGGQPDYFLRNEGSSFRDVTEEVGLLTGEDGATLGHSVLWLDYDGDGWEDLYVANDFRMPDFLYLNNGDGTFRVARNRLPVAPYSSMGSDLGDVNGDGFLDILATDMASPDYGKHVESMLTSAVKTRDLPVDSRPTQVMKNALLVNRGRGDYVDVAYAWNVAATDWTWASRLVDLDNDGWQDALFTNGMIRQFHNADLALKQDAQRTQLAKVAVFKNSPTLDEPNLVFRNVDGAGFALTNADWGFERKSVSFGAAVLDMDRDGDLDVVYTNYESPPTVWRNEIGGGNATQVELQGSGRNRDAIGAVAVAHFGGRKIASKILANRGYLGSDQKLLHFGLGEAEGIDRLEILWPDGARSVCRNLAAGNRYRVNQDGQEERKSAEVKDERPARFIWLRERQGERPGTALGNRSERAGLLYPFKPIPGPAKSRLIRSDFNGDGKLDTVINRDWQSPRLLLSGPRGMEEASDEWGVAEMAGLWGVIDAADFNADGYPDLFLGGFGINNEISYRSDGDGRFVRAQGRFSDGGPPVNVNGYEWNGEMRLYDGLRDLAEVESSVTNVIPTFRASGLIGYTSFLEKMKFQIGETYDINRFRSGVLLNQGGKGFHFIPLAKEGQYGRVWDAVIEDLNVDGRLDLLLLLGQVTPHYRSSQPEGSFVVLLWGQGDGHFAADDLPPFDRPTEERAIALECEKEQGERIVRLVSESGRMTDYRVRETTRSESE